MEAAFSYDPRTPPCLLTLDVEDAWELGRRLVEAVPRAKRQLVATSGVRIRIDVVANGYHLADRRHEFRNGIVFERRRIWRVFQRVLRIVDLIAPVESN